MEYSSYTNDDTKNMMRLEKMTMVNDILIILATALIFILTIWVVNLAIVNRQQRMVIERFKNANLDLTNSYMKLFENTIRIIDESFDKELKKTE